MIGFLSFFDLKNSAPNTVHNKAKYYSEFLQFLATKKKLNSHFSDIKRCILKCKQYMSVLRPRIENRRATSDNIDKLKEKGKYLEVKKNEKNSNNNCLGRSN